LVGCKKKEQEEGKEKERENDRNYFFKGYYTKPYTDTPPPSPTLAIFIITMLLIKIWKPRHSGC
jgi:hypothetical protein